MKIELIEAVKTTGKSLSTIRRLAKQPKSEAFTEIKDGKILIDVNYLYSVFPAVQAYKKSAPKTTHALQKDNQNDYPNEQLNELQNKLFELEKELIAKKTALDYQTKTMEQQEKRIEDLQQTIRLLGYEKGDNNPLPKRKWWQWKKS